MRSWTRSASSSSRESEHAVGRTLILNATKFKVRIATPQSAEDDNMKPGDLNPLEARMLMENIVKAGDTIRAMIKRGMRVPESMKTWMEQSTIEFKEPINNKNGEMDESRPARPGEESNNGRVWSDVGKKTEISFRTPGHDLAQGIRSFVSGQFVSTVRDKD